MSVSNTLATTLSDRLATITVANGYQTDIGTNVFRGRRRLDLHQIPCAVIIEGDERVLSEQRAALPGRAYKKSLQLAQQYDLEGHAACDADHPNDMAHKIIADIKKCLFTGDVTFSGLVKDIKYIARAISPREDGFAVVAGAIRIELEFVEDLTNP